MYRALTLVVLATQLCGCLAMPYAATTAPQDLGPRPGYLTNAQLAAINARAPIEGADPLADIGDTLRSRADAVRAQ